MSVMFCIAAACAPIDSARVDFRAVGPAYIVTMRDGVPATYPWDGRLRIDLAGGNTIHADGNLVHADGFEGAPFAKGKTP